MADRIKPGVVAGAVLVCGLALLPEPASAQAKALSPQCKGIDFSSPQSVFECMGTIRHRNGPSKFQRIERRRCAEVISQLHRELGLPSPMRGGNDGPVMSCAVVVEASKLMSGQAPYWSACIDYPDPDRETHMRECMRSFAPAYYGERGFERQIATCEGFIRGYELALKSANERHNQKVPEGYAPPECGAVNQAIAAVTGGAVKWAECASYDPGRVREHLLACVAAKPEEFLRWRDCSSVRMVYEERLQATHGGLPGAYSILSCADAQAVLDKADAYRQAQEAERIARAEEQERRHRAAADRERQRVEAARAKILAERQTGQDGPPDCEAGPNQYPDHDYGEVLTALETSCAHGLSPRAQLFAAGLAEGLVTECGLPKDMRDRQTVAKFVAASVPVGVGGTQYDNPDIGAMMRDQSASQTAYLSGAMTFRSLEGCDDPLAVAFAEGLTSYLARTASGSAWIDGCELHYAGQYSRAQCECMANGLRAANPNIHAEQFSRGAIRNLIDGAPLAAFQMATRCGIGNY